MDNVTEFLNKYFRVVVKGQSYLNLIYLLLAFPLGLIYFVVLITGLSLGVGLIIIWIGLLVLMLVFALWMGFISLERLLANALLREKIDFAPPRLPEGLSMWEKFKAVLKDPSTWTGLAYLFLKFPLGIFTFVTIFTSITLTLSLISAPFTYPFATFDLGFMQVNSLADAFTVCLVGMLLWPVTLHIGRALAWVSASFARIMLTPRVALSLPAMTTDSAVDVTEAPAEAPIDPVADISTEQQEG